MRKTRKTLKIGRGTLRRAMVRHERLEDLKSLIKDFWTNNTRVSPNQNHNPHVKIFLDSTQTQFFAKIIGMYPQI